MLYVILAVIFLFIILFLFALKLRLGISIRGIKPTVYVKVLRKKIYLYPAKKKAVEKAEKDVSDGEARKAIYSTKELWSENKDDIKKALSRLKSGIVIEELVFNYKCGFDDAPLTAVMFGAVNGLFYNIYALLDRHFRIKNMHGGIYPDFQEKKKLIELDCILYLTVWDIICIARALLPIIKKLKK